jgi:hypothetical protein
MLTIGIEHDDSKRVADAEAWEPFEAKWSLVRENEARHTTGHGAS